MPYTLRSKFWILHLFFFKPLCANYTIRRVASFVSSPYPLPHHVRPTKLKTLIFAHERNPKIMTQRNINLTLPRSWNECSTEQLELVSRIMLEQIQRADRYHPFDMRNVKIACFFVLSGIEIVEGIDESKPLEEQHYTCRLSPSSRRKQQEEETFPVYLWQLNYWLTPKSKTGDRNSAEYLASGTGLLDWLDNERGAHLTRFPYPTLRLRNKRGLLRRKTYYEGPAQDMDGFSWQQYRFASDIMGQYTSLANNLVKMKQMGKFTLEQIAQQADSVDQARSMFLATIFNRRIDFIDTNTNLKVHDFHYDPRQFDTQSLLFRHFSDHQWQPILFWWAGMMHTLSRRYPHVFKVQKFDRTQRPSTPLEIYTATIATMQKYASLTEDQVNNQSYSLVLEHLERLSKENEEMEKIRKK